MPNLTGRIYMKNVSVTFDGTPYLGNTTKTTLTPSQDVQQLRTLDPGYTLSDVNDATWVFDVSGPVIEDGLWDYIMEHVGEEIEVVLQPMPGSGRKTATFTVIALALPFGGEQGAYSTFDASFPVVGDIEWGTSV